MFEYLLALTLNPFLDPSWPTQLDAGTFWGFTLVMIGSSLVLFWFTFRNFYKARIIQDTPTSKIRSAAQGYAELCGYPAEMPLVSPLSKTPCAWYKYEIEQPCSQRWQGSGLRWWLDWRWKHWGWSSIKSGASHATIVLKDDTGICYLDVEQADIRAEYKRWNTQENPMPDSMGFFSGLSQMLSFSQPRFRCTEYLITAYDNLYAIGRFHSIPAPSYQAQVDKVTSELLTEWKQDRDKLAEQFDQNGDGQIDMTEWTNAREAATRIAQQSIQTELDTHPTHCLSAPKFTNLPFIISTKKQNDLANHYKRYAFVFLLGFLFSFSEVLLYLIGRFVL